MTNLGLVSLVLNVIKRKRMVDIRPTAYSVTVTNGYIQWVITKGAGSLVDWMKTAVKFVYLKRETVFPL